MIWKLADLIEENPDELAEIESLDNGKPLMTATADVPLAARCCATSRDGRPRSGDTIPDFRGLHPGAITSPIPCASRWAWSARSFPGTSR